MRRAGFVDVHVDVAHVRRRGDSRRPKVNRHVTLDTLREFVDALDAAGELVRITRPVSLDRELCEIADRVMKQPGGGKALLFEQPDADERRSGRRFRSASTSSDRCGAWRCASASRRSTRSASASPSCSR